MEWDNDKCLELIGLYEKKAELWQPEHKYHHNKFKKNIAWEEIATTMGLSIESLKGKINSLLASHRREVSKEQSSKGPGKGQNDVYNSKWFAFQALRFIKDKNKCKQAHNSSALSQNSQELNSQVEDKKNSAIADNIDIDEDDYVSMDVGDLLEFEQVLTHTQQRSNVTSPASTSKDDRFIQPPPQYKRKKKSPSTSGTSQVDLVVDILQRSLERNACDVYGEHVAMKLKTYDKKTQALVQHYINNILFDADMGSIEVPVQHQSMFGIYSTPPSPHYSNHQRQNSQRYTPLQSPSSSPSSNASSAIGLAPINAADKCDLADTLPDTGD